MDELDVSMSLLLIGWLELLAALLLAVLLLDDVDELLAEELLDSVAELEVKFRALLVACVSLDDSTSFDMLD